MVNITFEFQKNDERNESVGLFAAGADDDMCPVKATAAIVGRVRGYTDIDADINDRKVNLFKDDKGKMTEITSVTIRKKLRRAATSIGEARLGFKALEIGLSFYPFRSRNGPIPSKSTNTHNHDHWKMEKRRIPAIHPETSRTILPAPIIKDVG